MMISQHSQHSASVHATRKSRISDPQRQRITALAASGAWGVARPLPVIFESRVIAWVGWSAREDAVYAFEHKPWLERHIDDLGVLFGIPTVDALIVDATTNGKLKQSWWYKWTQSTTPQTLSWLHWWNVDGCPAAGLWNGTALTAKRHSDADVGALPHGGNVSTDTKHLVSGTIRSATTVVGDYSMFCLYDMVLSYDQCGVSSSASPFDNTLTALRYVGVGKPGLQIMGVLDTTSAGSTGYSALTYTAAGGAAGISVPGIAANYIVPVGNAPSASSPALSCINYASTGRGQLVFPLRTGDSGVNQLESVTFGATTADKVNFILGFPIAYMIRGGGNEYTYAHDFVKSESSVARIYDGACLTFASMVLGSSVLYHGDLNFVWGT